MSQVKYRLFPRTDFDIDFWSTPSTFDLFDIFDPLDWSLPATQSIEWVERPRWLVAPGKTEKAIPVETARAKKYRITLNLKGISAKSVRTQVVDGNQLVVTAKEGEARPEAPNYTLREIKRTYKLPTNAETDKLASYVAPNGKLVIEIPLTHMHTVKEGDTQAQQHPSSDEGVPRIIDGKRVEMTLRLPERVDASKVRASCKDHDLIVMVEEEQEKDDQLSEFFYYRRMPMPDDTDLKNIRCTLEPDGQLVVSAPLKHSHPRSHQAQHQKVGGGVTTPAPEAKAEKKA